MDDKTWLAEQFEQNRPRLRAVAYRMLGSLSEADDAVQDTWVRLNRSDAGGIDNLPGWLTTVVSRVCLNVLQSRRIRGEEPLGVRQPDPIITVGDEVDPEQQALLADSVGLALLVVLETLAPSERLAFVLHDMFAMPFDEIAPIVGRTPAAARQLASRARRRVQHEPTVPEPDLTRQRRVVDAFLAASRNGDFDALVAVLDPDVVLRADDGGGGASIHGAATVAAQALTFARFSTGPTYPALVNGAAGVVRLVDGKPVAVMGFTIVGDLIAAIDILADAERLARLDVTFD